MDNYQIQITETLQKVVAVEAKNEAEAVDKVMNDYNDGKLYLTGENMTDYRIDNLEKIDERRRAWLVDIITKWVGKNYGTQEAEDPCYSLEALADELIKKGL